MIFISWLFLALSFGFSYILDDWNASIHCGLIAIVTALYAIHERGK